MRRLKVNKRFLSLPTFEERTNLINQAYSFLRINNRLAQVRLKKVLILLLTRQLIF